MWFGWFSQSWDEPSMSLNSSVMVPVGGRGTLGSAIPLAGGGRGHGGDLGARGQLEEGSVGRRGEVGDLEAGRILRHLDVAEEALGGGADGAETADARGLEVDAAHAEPVDRHGGGGDFVAGETGRQREALEEVDPMLGCVEVEDVVLVGRAECLQALAAPARAVRAGILA